MQDPVSLLFIGGCRAAFTQAYSPPAHHVEITIEIYIEILFTNKDKTKCGLQNKN